MRFELIWQFYLPKDFKSFVFHQFHHNAIKWETKELNFV